MINDKGKIYYGLGLDNAQLRADAAEARSVIKSIGDTTVSEGNRIDGSMRKIGVAVMGAFSVQQAAQFAKTVVDVRGEIEALEKSFVVLAGHKGIPLFNEIRAFATDTTFQLGDLAKGAQTLMAFNIEADRVMPILRQIGDISMGNVDKFNSLILAFAQMSSTGKLMGQDLLQMINAGFNPLTIISDKTGKSIAQLKKEMEQGGITSDMVADAFESATAAGGKFNGMLEDQSKGIKGLKSNLEGAWEEALNSIGEKNEEVIKGSIQGVTLLVQNYEKVGRVIAELIGVYGVYKAALITLNAVEAVQIQLTSGWTLAELAHYKALVLVEKAQKLLNATILKNPYVAAAAAVVALGYGIYKLVTYQTDAEKAQEKLNDAVRESETAIDSERHQIDAMFARLKAAKEGTDEYRSAKEAIMNKYGEYLKGLGDETTALNDVAAAYTLITKEAKKAAQARAMEAFTKDAADTLAKKENEVKDDVYEMLKKQFKGQKGADGIDLAETYYWKIKPVIEGEAEVTDEIQGIISQFERTGYYGGGMFGGGGSYQYNPLQDKINAANKARGIYNNTMSEAQRRFGDNPLASGNEDQTPAFDAMTASLQQLMDRLPKAQQELAALRAADTPDPAAIAAKEKEIQTIEAQTLAREKQLTVIKDVKAQIEVLQKEQQNYAADSDEYEALEVRIKALQKKLPKTDGQENREETEAARIKRETAERTEQICQYRDTVAREVKQAEFDIRQSQIDAMEEGFSKQQAQIQLTYERMIFENEQRQQEWVEALRDAKELEWQNANPNYKTEGKTFDRSSVTADDLSEEQKTKIKGFADFAAQYQRDSNAKLLEDLLADFQTYNQQREKIEAEFADKRKALYVDGDESKGLREGVTQGNVDELNRQEEEALTAVDEQFASREETYQAWMNSIANMTLEQLEEVLAKAESELAELEKQNPDDPKLAQARAKVSTARQKVSEKKAENDVSPNKRSIEEWNDLRDALNDVAKEFDTIGNAVGGVAGEIISTAGTVLTGTVGMVNGIVQLVQMSTTSMTATATAGATAISIVEKASVILTVISAALQIATAIANLFTKKHDEKHEKEIARLGEQVDVLQDSYDSLGESIEKAYSKDASNLIEQQNQLLEQQKVLIQQQIAEENEKKNADEDRIKQWEQQLEDIDKQIAENKEAAVDAVFGEDLKQAIEDFADAYVEAWENGKKGPQTAKDYVKQMMRDMVIESIKAAIQSSKAIEEIRAKLLEFYADGVFDAAEQEWANKKAEELQNDLDAQFGWADSLFASDAVREGSKSGIATASQESVDELNGRATAIQSHTYTIAECQKVLVETTQQMLEAVWGIERNTGRLEAIESDMRSVKNTVNDIALKGIKLK